MKIKFSRQLQCLSVLWLLLWAAAPRAAAQARPSLALRFSAGQPTLNLTAEAGTVCSIQYASELSSTNVWVERTLMQAQGAGNAWTDPSAPASTQGFYRAISVPPPADHNLVFIQPGTFTMGSPTNEAERSLDEVQHLVTISRGFWIGKYLVTQGDYLSVVGSNPSHFQPPGFVLDLTRPAEEVSWFNATNYCALRTQLEQAGGLIPTNYVYRLPTESEWEYACRAGTTAAFYLGSDLHSGQANFDGRHEYDAASGTLYNPNGIQLGTTTPVGSYAPNGWELYDMLGNVLEWCQDSYGPYPAGSVVDPQGAVSGSNRVVRGGFWFGAGRLCRSAVRPYAAPQIQSSNLGFRVVLAPAEP
jgi:formylglycine-generating enzyme required for sulfatase activity